MPLTDLPRLRATLGAPELKRLVDALQSRLERGRPLTGGLTLDTASASERMAVDGLLGRVTTRGASLGIDLDFLAATLNEAGICATLAEAVQALRGPIHNRRALAAEIEVAWEKVYTKAAKDLAPWPTLIPWLDELFASGTIKRLGSADPVKAERLLDELTIVAKALPAEVEPLATFAARLFGDAHALDQGSPRATLAVRAAALLGNVLFDDDAEGWRTAWASSGILCDELSTPALVLNLPSASETPLGRLLRAARADGEPLHLALRHLMLWPLAADPVLDGLTVFACENPTVVALAARRLGTACAPLVCVNGQFATPSKILLRQLRSAGARLRYHGDFDGGGLRIARRVFTDHGASPWRMNAEDYLAAPKGKPIESDVPLASPWDPELAMAMSRERRAVHEESLTDLLLSDLNNNPS